MSYSINPTDWDKFDDECVDHDRIDMRIIIRQRLADRTAFHPDVEVAVEEAVDQLLDLRDDGLSLDAGQVDAVIRSCIAYDPTAAGGDEWAEVA
ncbi:MAG: hypothetical protein LKG15_07705 [Corynebacterium provencense]|jgi:hypothetical protein|uniref:hypothetical protein n=1 Tax=Corynebacterium provencense TaxID=1737425 RepID=UPI002989D60F|nr:hypothetical protein [Corynebacterium provencense]